MRSFKLLLSFTGIALFFLVFSCKKDATKTIDFKYGYFPVDTGHWVLYDVDSITYNSFYTPIKIDTIHFQIKEIIRSIYLDNTGYPTCRIEGYRRNTPTDQWPAQPTYVWHCNRYTTSAQKTEENLTFIKLIFPPNLTTVWSGNSYIDCVDTNAYLAGWNYMYQSIDVPLQLASPEGNLSFDSTLTVLQDSNVTYTNYTFAKEKYAKNAGLIYRQVTNLIRQDSLIQDTIPWPRRATSGYIYNMTAVAYNR